MNGNTISLKNYAAESRAYLAGEPGNLKTYNDSILIACGTFVYFDTLFPVNQGEYGIVYLISREAADTLKSFRLNGNGRVRFYNSDITSDTILLIGYTLDTTFSYAENYIAAINIYGNIIWGKTFPQPFSSVGLSIDHFNNKNLVVGAFKENDDLGLFSDGIMYKLNADGEQYFSRLYASPLDDGGVRIKVSSNEDRFIMTQTIDTLINEGDYPYINTLSKTDTNGNYIWRTFFHGPNSYSFWHFREIANNDIIVCGTRQNESGIAYGYLCRLDSNGNKLWERTSYTDTTYHNYFTDAQQLPGGGFIVTGTAVGEINYDMWLVKLDSLGCLEPGCGGVPVINLPLSNALFSIYPNPVISTATVEIHIPDNFNIIPGAKLSLDIYDITGRRADRYANIPVHNPNEVTV